jgi:hypothetical protein
VTSAVHDQENEAIRWLISSRGASGQAFIEGHVLVWSYGESQRTERATWHTESLPGCDSDEGDTVWSGRCAAMWGSRYVVGARSLVSALDPEWLVQHTRADSGYVASETGFVSSIELGRVRPGYGAGHGRLKSFVLLGEQGDTAGVIEAAVTYDETTERTITLPAASTSGEFVVHVSSPVQKCHHATITLREDQSAGTASDGIAWNAVTIEVEKLPGMRRLPAARRV